jgi:hypothetical protein
VLFEDIFILLDWTLRFAVIAWMYRGIDGVCRKSGVVGIERFRYHASYDGVGGLTECNG